MTRIADLYGRLMGAFGVGDLQISATYVKLFRQDAVVPEAVQSCAVDQETLTVCQAVRHAALDQAVYLTGAASVVSRRPSVSGWLILRIGSP